MSLTSFHSGASYAAIGGGATPFFAHTEIEKIVSNTLTNACQRHVRKNEKRKSRGIVPFSHYTGTYRLGQLYGRTGYHLQIHNNGRINGTRRDDSPFGVLEFLSIAFGLVSIKGKASQNYLCMNRRGHLVGRFQVNYSNECVFMERMLDNYYNTYASCAYYTSRRRKTRRWYVALNRKGRTRNGRKSRKKKKYTNFLVLHLDDEDYKDTSWRQSQTSSPWKNSNNNKHRLFGSKSRFGLDFSVNIWRQDSVKKYIDEALKRTHKQLARRHRRGRSRKRIT